MNALWIFTLFLAFAGGGALGLTANEATWRKDCDAIGAHAIKDGPTYDCRSRAVR